MTAVARAGAALVILGCGAAGSSLWSTVLEPTATPRPKRLGDLASEVRMNATETPSPTVPRLVLDDVTVRRMAREAEVTGPAPAPTAKGTPTPAPPANGTTARARWKETYAARVHAVVSVRGQAAELDATLPELWKEFYLEDDPERRETVCRARLDAALEQRHAVASSLDEAVQALAAARRDALEAGAEPGWFRDLDRLLGPWGR